MATPTGRATYSGWLDQIAQQGRTDDYGRVAAGWLNAQPNGRPKYHAPKSVNRWLSEHPPPGVVNLQATLHQLEQHYHQQAALPGDPAITAGQQPDPAAEQQQDWFASPEGQAWLASPDGQAWIASQHVSAGQEPVQEELYPAQPADEPALPPAELVPPVPFRQPGQEPDWPAMAAQQEAENQAWHAQQPPDQPWQQQAPPEHPWQVVMLALGRVEAMIAAMYRAMDPLMRLAAESEAAEAALAASQLASPAQARARQIAAEHGWTPGPAFQDDYGQAEAERRAENERAYPQMPPGGSQRPGWNADAPPGMPVAPPTPPLDFYGGHVVQQPNFGAMADASDGTEDAG